MLGCAVCAALSIGIAHAEEQYHFVDTYSVCENEEFNWRERTQLNRLGIGQTTHYYDRFQTWDGQDSIYELVLTVRPVIRRSQTIPFCNVVTWKGTDYTKTTVLVDTLPSIIYSCDSIVTTILYKSESFHSHDTATIVPGEELFWHGQTITTNGYYEDKHTNVAGCDSTYSIGVGIKEAVFRLPIHTDYVSICEGDAYPWREKIYRESGIFVDTLYKAGSTTEIDSLYVLNLSFNPTYALTERVTYSSFPQFYRGIEIPDVGTYSVSYTSSKGCDSTYTIYVDLEILRDEQNAVICSGETFTLRGTAYSITGQYKEVEKDNKGNVIAEHILNLTVLPKRETRITESICQGSSYTFGNQTLTQSGVYSYTYHIDGCDSTVILSLNVLDADTITDVVTLDAGGAYTWPRDHQIYRVPGVYYHYSTGSNGCRLTEVLILTETHVDTVDTTVTVCPSELPFEWHGIRASQTNTYQKEEKQPNGDYIWYRLHLTVRELKDTTVNFVVCGDANVTFNGKKYTAAGYYEDYLSCDTVAHIHITRLPIAVYETNATLSADHGYTWTYKDATGEHTEVFNAPGTYEYESPNPETGCNDLWRLILAKDASTYHFVETLTICEGDPFSWHGLTNLSRITGTNSYLDEYKTRTGQDSIYELILTVTPYKRTVQTQYFCGEMVWNGVTYTESAVMYDTVATAEGCYEIIRTNLEKARPFLSIENRELVQGDTILWHGQTIWGDGVFYDKQKTIHGCDSIYELHVTAIAAPPHTNMYIEQMSICKGDTLFWRGKDIWTEGRYVDTVKTGVKDSIFILNLTVWPSYKDTIVRHLYTCGSEASIRYQGKDYFSDTALVSNLSTAHGCDSLVKVYLHFNTALYLSDTVKIADTQLPYTWTFRLSGPKPDTVLTTAGTFLHTEPAEGSCVNREEIVLIVYPTYLYEDSITICETQLPYHWLNGPADHVDDDLRHSVGTSKQYVYRYTTINNTDSIYRLQLTIDPAPKRTERIYFCEGERLKVGDKTYFRIQSDSVYRDTIFKFNPANECDSIIYYEIYQHPQKALVETAILHVDSVIEWKGNTIERPGTYNAVPDSIDEVTGCPIIQQLRVIGEQRDYATICALDTPYIWQHKDHNDTLYTAGLWTDTVYDEEHVLMEFHSLDLQMLIPVDTIKVLRGCKPEGVTWNGVTYLTDTVFRDTLLTCDTIYTVKIELDTTYKYIIHDTICEHELPYVVGQTKKDSIYTEGWSPEFPYKTACGCDSVVQIHLTIIPDFERTDSVFVCSDFFKDGKVVLGDTVHPAFDPYRLKVDEWKGKWVGVRFDKDTIVYNCDSSLHFHIIARPSQTIVKDTTFYLCPDDSLQLFWPRDDSTWFYKDTVYEEHVPMTSYWTDAVHGYSYSNDAYTCDSVTIWHIKKLNRYHKDSTAHKLLGDSIWWGGAWRYYTGTYDSIAPSPDTSSLGDTCMYIYPLHLIMDTAYYFRDTITICSPKNKTHTHVWAETGYKQRFTVGTKDTLHWHFVDSLLTYDRRDSIYDLCVNFFLTYETHVYDTICAGDSAQIDTYLSELRPKRFYKTTGIYHDTVPSVNECDSVITLHLQVWPRVPANIREKHIADVDTPFLWTHAWLENGTLKRDTDTLYISGGYSRTLPNIHGCDSIDSLTLYVHKTYHIQDDTLNICERETPYTWRGLDNISRTGDYSYGEQTVEGYDSVHYVHVNVWKQTYDTVTAFVCEGDSMRWGMERKTLKPRYAAKAGLYNDTLVTAHGCDSIRVLQLIVYPRYYKDTTIHIRDVDTPYVWKHVNAAGVVFKNDSLYASGRYGFRYASQYACDSIDSLTLVLHNTYLFKDTITICERETPYTWQNRNDITESGDYIYNPRTHDHYDSIYMVSITVIPTRRKIIHEDICADRLPFIFHGTPLNKGGIFRDTIASELGCDSIVELHLTVHDPYYHYERKDIYEGQTYMFFGKPCTESGTYTHEAHTPAGCDSISELLLVVHPLVDTVATVCSYDLPFAWVNHWNGRTTLLHRAGLYHDDTTYVNGVRTFWSIQLNVEEPKYDTIRYAMCEGATYLFKGNTYDKSGVYQDTLTAANGCDSIVTLILTVNKPYYNVRTEHVLQGQSVEFFGDLYSTTDTYYHYAVTPKGCDSTSVLQLTVYPLVDTVVTRCANDLPFVWKNRWSGKEEKYYAAGTYRNDTTINGEKQYYGVRLLVTQPSDTTIYREICEGSYYNFGGIQRSEFGEYRDTLINSKGCDSIVILHLNVLKTYHNTVYHAIYEGDSVEFMGAYYKEAGAYPLRYTSSYGCDSIIELQLTVKRLYDDSVSVCTNELPLVWRSRQIFESGIYRDTVFVDGKEVVTGLKVTVLPVIRATEPMVATICEGDRYKFGDAVLTEQGVYYDTLTAASGCDSIVMLSLQVVPLKYQTEYRRIFEGDSVFFNGEWLKESGVYEKRETNANNCTDTYQLILTVLKTYNIDTAAVVCKNELPFIWRGYEYNATGEYSLPISWTDSSRVVKTLHLTVNETFYGERNLVLCSGDTIEYNGRKVFASESFYDTIPSMVGCDSIIKYVVSVHPTYDRIFEKHISDKQKYGFHVEEGRDSLSSSGIYEWTGTTVNGCDSMEHLILTVHPSFFQSDTVDICQSDTNNYPYKWRNFEITQSGVYSDSLLTSYGFDSVYRRVVNIHPSYMINEQYEIGVGEVLKIHGRDISKPAIYYDTLRTIHGCDSIFHIVINQKRTREFTWERTICEFDPDEYPYKFFGRVLTHTGRYTYTSPYKDSVVTLNLTVNPRTIYENRIVIADTKDYHTYDGKLYEHLKVGDNLFTDTLRNQYGCDSIKRLIINVTKHYSEWTPVPLCPGSEVKIDGQVITEAGLYTFVRRSRVTGEMDSLYRVEVYDAPAFEYDVAHTVCFGDTVFYGDKGYSRAGHYDIVLKTTDGCDSVYHLDLTVNPAYSFYRFVTTQDYMPYEWFGKTYIESGVYERTWPTVNDCDSTYTLDLHVVETLRDTITETICTGQSFNWRDKQYSVDGYYTDTVWQPEARFSAIYSLRLIVAYPTIITSARTGDICADAENFDILFDYSGQKPTHYSVYFDQLAKREGFEDIIDAPFGSDMIAHVNLPQFSDVVYQGHPYYVRPDYYTFRIALDNGVCGISRSDSLTLLIKYPSWILEQNWNDVVAPLKADYNGGYEFAQTEWYVNGVQQINTPAGYLYSKELKEGDQVVMVATRQGESVAIPTCPLIIQTPMPNAYATPVIVYPTQAPRQMPQVTIDAQRTGSFAVWSSTGMLITTGSFEQGKTTVTLPSMSGMYFIRTIQGDDAQTHKVLLY